VLSSLGVVSSGTVLVQPWPSAQAWHQDFALKRPQLAQNVHSQPLLDPGDQNLWLPHISKALEAPWSLQH
jgi:hypothetical protein